MLFYVLMYLVIEGLLFLTDISSADHIWYRKDGLFYEMLGKSLLLS
jgi:hypothetical protein